MPFQERSQLPALYAQFDLFVLPALHATDGDRDGVPNVLIEAMLAGLAVISTPISGIPELVADEKSGLLVPEKDSGALATAILRLAQNPELSKQLSLNGREKALQYCDLKRSSQQLLALFSAD